MDPIAYLFATHLLLLYLKQACVDKQWISLWVGHSAVDIFPLVQAHQLSGMPGGGSDLIAYQLRR
jgi:hypothetical protein